MKGCNVSHNDRRLELLAQMGLTAEEAKRPEVRLLAARVVITERDLQRVEAELVGKVGVAGRDAMDTGSVMLATDLTPLMSVAHQSARVDAELVRLDERRAALHIVAQQIVAERPAPVASGSASSAAAAGRAG
jgi:hypothetical protein